MKKYIAIVISLIALVASFSTVYIMKNEYNLGVERLEKQKPNIVVKIETANPFYTIGPTSEAISQADINILFRKFTVAIMANEISDLLREDHLLTMSAAELIHRRAQLLLAKVISVKVHIPFTAIISNNGRSTTTLLSTNIELLKNQKSIHKLKVDDLRIKTINPGEVEVYNSNVNISGSQLMPFLKEKYISALETIVTKSYSYDEKDDKMNIDTIKRFADNQFERAVPESATNSLIDLVIEVVDQHNVTSRGSTKIKY